MRETFYLLGVCMYALKTALFQPSSVYGIKKSSTRCDDTQGRTGNEMQGGGLVWLL